jgi:4'-phosphopantetheinyl transferase
VSPVLTTSPTTVWRSPPLPLLLGKDDVHVWRVHLDESPARIETLFATLAPGEQTRANRCLRPRDRDRFVVARGALRTILATYLNRPATSLAFRYGAQGKPALQADSTEDDLSFNLSHSNDMALYAVARTRDIGIDVEFTGRRIHIERIAERFFSPREFDALKALPPSLRRYAFFRCWTGKEAYVKAKGEGLARSLAHFAVSVTPSEPMALLGVEWDPDEVTRWSMQEISPAPDYLATIAVQGQDWTLSCWDWP